MEQLLQFVYCNGAGEVSQRRLLRWKESGHYVTGFDAEKEKVLTFRKDRIHSYLEGCEALLQCPIGMPPPRVTRAAPVATRPQILFTGFERGGSRKELEKKAEEGGLHVVKSVTTGLVFLCCGPNAGPRKMEQAREQGVYIVGEPEFHQLLETGELPDHVVHELASDGTVADRFKVPELLHLRSLWPRHDKKKNAWVRVPRSTELIVPRVEFAGGQGHLQNEHWAYVVDYPFSDAIDIKFEQRVQGDKSWMVWTQGPLLRFGVGDILHRRDRKGMVQVQFATPMGWDAQTNDMYQGAVVYDEFSSDGGTFKPKRRVSATQMQFLGLLITGAEVGFQWASEDPADFEKILESTVRDA